MSHARSIARGAAAIGLLLTAPVLTACSGGADTAASPSSGQVAPPSEETASQAPPSPSAADGDAAPTAIPDACAVLSGEDLTTLTGVDNGAGSAMAGGSDLKSTCLFASGLITSVVKGSEFDGVAAVMKADANAEGVRDLAGAGDRAVIGTYGGGAVVQVVVLQGDYAVSVTGALTEEQATATAQAMLAAL